MNATEIHARLAAKFGEQIGALSPANKDAFAVVKPETLLEVCRYLKEDPELAFDCLMNLGATDWPKKNQIEVVYHLWSYAKRHAFVLKVQLDRAAPKVASVYPVWKAADWLEREQFDLMGVTFEGHPDLRRIMMPDDWVGHPLRKDYKEPSSWHNITTTRENPLEGFIRLDELKKKAAGIAPAPAAPAHAPAAAKPAAPAAAKPAAPAAAAKPAAIAPAAAPAAAATPAAAPAKAPEAEPAAAPAPAKKETPQ